jgi:hypothetical protein
LQWLPTVAADRHGCVAGFKGVAIAAQRFRVRAQAPGENASGKTNAGKGFHARYFRSKPPSGVMYGHFCHGSDQATIRLEACRA